MSRMEPGEGAEGAGRPSLALRTTARLIGLVRAGDAEAREQLFARYLAPLQRWARGRLPRWARDLVETDDLVQDTLLRTVRRIDRFDPRHSGAFQAYLRQALLNGIRSEIRRIGRRPPADGTVSRAVDPRPSPLEEAIGEEALDRYEAALSRLRPADREAVIARIELGFSYQEVALALGKSSPDAARMAVSRALLRLAAEMVSGGEANDIG